MFIALSLFLTVMAMMAWANERWLKWPTAVGVTFISAITTFSVLIWHQHVSPLSSLVNWTASWQFDELLMNGVLCFLLFASALHVDSRMLRKEKIMILLFTTIGVALSSIFTGTGIWLILKALGVNWNWTLCLLIGIILSPTDAVVAADALKRAKLPERLKAKIMGESLFNDGTAVVLFVAAISLIFHQETSHFFDWTESHFKFSFWNWIEWPVFFIWQGLGGAIIGGVIGYIMSIAIKSIRQPTVELLLTLACATASYTIAEHVSASAPISVAFAGLVVSHMGRTRTMDTPTQERIFSFWEMLDELLNVALFVLIGLQLLRVPPSFIAWVAGILAVPAVLLARYFSVLIPILIAKPFRAFSERTITWMTWGGLRGGISLALALSVPDFQHDIILLTICYVVILFSIIVQGGLIIPWLSKQNKTEPVKIEDPIHEDPSI